jgi:hypothetical protein
MNNRPLTDSEKSELDSLNKAVNDSVMRRKLWLDTKMFEVANLKIGDDIYNITTGQRLGVVSGIYRCHEGDQRYDNNVSVNYQYCVGNNCHDNTSRQFIRVGTKDDAITYHKGVIASMERQWGLPE